MENLKGSNYSWGLVAKIFHWTLAVFILSQILFALIYILWIPLE